MGAGHRGLKKQNNTEEEAKVGGKKKKIKGNPPPPSTGIMGEERVKEERFEKASHSFGQNQQPLWKVLILSLMCKKADTWPPALCVAAS